MQDFYIERIETEKASFLREVAIKAYAGHYLELWYDNGKWYLENFFSLEKLTQELNDINSRFFIAFNNSVPVGFLKLNINAATDGFEAKDALELERIYLNKEATGQGIGKKLMQITTSVAIENNKKVIWLKAMDTSHAPIAFYRKMGFEITGTYLLKHQLMKEELRGMVVMTKHL